MEINKYTDIMGVVAAMDIPEGRMCLLTSHPFSIDFGSQEDLPGVKLPADDAESKFAKYCVTWQVNNSNAEGAIRMFIPMPSYDWALRGGWDQSDNVPFNADVYLTYPGHQHGVTIPSGFQALAFDRGVFTVPSGHFVWSVDLETPGSLLEVLNTADETTDSGKLAYAAAGTIAVTERYDSSTGSLTFRTL